MKFFIDTANLDEIREANSIGVLDGVTTNPTLLAKEGVKGQREIEKHIRKICEIVDGPVSAEAVSSSAEDLINEARAIASIHKNIVVKIPMTVEGMKAVKTLSQEDIKTNVTLVFSPLQALMAAKAGATFVSPFVGRLDDISHNGMQLVADIVEIYSNYMFETEIIVASIRNPLHVLDAALFGADIATIPFGVIEKISRHPLTDAGIEKFLADYRKMNP